MRRHRNLRYRARACAYCAFFATFREPYCQLDGEKVSMEYGTCNSWVLDGYHVFTHDSAHEKAEAIVLKTRTYREELT